MKNDQSPPDETRRELLKTMGAGALATALGGQMLGNPAIAATPSAAPKPLKAAGAPYNILFILTVDEAFMEQYVQPKAITMRWKDQG